MDCRSARLFVDYISSMTGWRGDRVRKRVNEVYVNNEGEEMNTSAAAWAAFR